jgi:NTP pyrophosphatase (non-canonical NTP hydrolase)
MTETQKSISTWTKEIFGEATSNARVAARANEEMAELLRALTSDDNHQNAVEEAADVVIILYRLADRMGIDLHAEIDRKMQVNRKRAWAVTADGHGYHVQSISRFPPANQGGGK